MRPNALLKQAQDFQLTTIDDLKSAIAKLQNQQMSERKLRNLKRLESFVLRMDQFEQVVTVYFNASIFVGFVWGPVKCLLLTASSYHAAFDALLEMYERIGLNLPQLEQYQSQFQSNAHMRTILHLIYADILRFHKKAMKFFKHPVWKQLFRAQWKNSKVKFSRIIESFRSHKTLLESQASLIQLTEHRKFVAEGEERYRREKDEDLWLTGIPGAGKTILAARIIQELQKSSSAKVIFFFCKEGDLERNSFLAFARALLGQLLRRNKALLPHLYERATDSPTGTLTSISSAQELLGLALRSLPSIFIVLDGVDECPPKESRTLVSWLQKEVESVNNDSGDACCLFVSQDNQICNQLLKDIPLVKLVRGFEYWKPETTISSNRRSSTPVLDLNHVIQAIQTEIENLSSKQPDLQNLYGKGLFNCNRLYCQLFVAGFTDSNRRDEHLKEHERSFFRKVPGCPAAQFGFASQSELELHNARCHQAPLKSTSFPVYQSPASIDVEHACMTGNLAVVERWAEQFGPDELEKRVWGTGAGKLMGPAIESAIHNEQLGITRFLLDRSMHPGKHILDMIGKAYLEKRYSFLQSILGLSHIKPDISEKDEKSIHKWVTRMFKCYDDVPAQGLLEYLRSHGAGMQETWMSKATEHDCMGSLKYLIGALEGRELVSGCRMAMNTAALYGKGKSVSFCLTKGSGILLPDRTTRR
ncbi:hypothetical protein BJX62DRAFT_241131 [Aspergillus germanicus]